MTPRPLLPPSNQHSACCSRSLKWTQPPELGAGEETFGNLAAVGLSNADAAPQQWRCYWLHAARFVTGIDAAPTQFQSARSRWNHVGGVTFAARRPAPTSVARRCPVHLRRPANGGEPAVSYGIGPNGSSTRVWVDKNGKITAIVSGECQNNSGWCPA